MKNSGFFRLYELLNFRCIFTDKNESRFIKPSVFTVKMNSSIYNLAHFEKNEKKQGFDSKVLI